MFKESTWFHQKHNQKRDQANNQPKCDRIWQTYAKYCALGRQLSGKVTHPCTKFVHIVVQQYFDSLKLSPLALAETAYATSVTTTTKNELRSVGWSFRVCWVLLSPTWEIPTHSHPTVVGAVCFEQNGAWLQMLCSGQHVGEWLQCASAVVSSRVECVSVCRARVISIVSDATAFSYAHNTQLHSTGTIYNTNIFQMGNRRRSKRGVCWPVLRWSRIVRTLASSMLDVDSNGSSAECRAVLCW